MDLAVLTGLRRGGLLALQRSQPKDDGIHVELKKTKRKAKRKLIIEWSDELRNAVASAKKIPTASEAVFHCDS
jgi:integrase